ncbi:MAG: hypothetical protein ACPGVN_05640 [Alphaproteobacteria bacterium]
MKSTSVLVCVGLMSALTVPVMGVEKKLSSGTRTVSVPKQAPTPTLKSKVSKKKAVAVAPAPVPVPQSNSNSFANDGKYQTTGFEGQTIIYRTNINCNASGDAGQSTGSSCCYAQEPNGTRSSISCP